jgi:hypothetical protein
LDRTRALAFVSRPEFWFYALSMGREFRLKRDYSTLSPA